MSILLSSKFASLLSKMLIMILILLGVTTTSIHSDTSKDPKDSSVKLDPNYEFLSSDNLGLYGPYINSSSNQNCESPIPPGVLPIYRNDVMQLQFAQNIEHLECDFFLWGALGYGLDQVAPALTLGGPSPIGVRKANLDNLTRDIITEFGFEEVGHLRALKKTVGGIQRPLMDLSPNNFAKIVNQAFESDLRPPFDPYRDSVSFMLGSYIIPYMGLTGYVGANPQIQGFVTRMIIAGLLGVEAGQDAVIRTYLYERRNNRVDPYNFTVEEFTNRISILRNKLGMCGLRDEGIVVPPELGAEGRTTTNVLSSNLDSLSYSRTPAQILRVLYESGNERIPGGFYPRGGNGEIARMFLGPR